MFAGMMFFCIVLVQTFVFWCSFAPEQFGVSPGNLESVVGLGWALTLVLALFGALAGTYGGVQCKKYRLLLKGERGQGYVDELLLSLALNLDRIYAEQDRHNRTPDRHTEQGGRRSEQLAVEIKFHEERYWEVRSAASMLGMTLRGASHKDYLKWWTKEQTRRTKEKKVEAA